MNEIEKIKQLFKKSDRDEIDKAIKRNRKKYFESIERFTKSDEIKDKTEGPIVDFIDYLHDSIGEPNFTDEKCKKELSENIPILAGLYSVERKMAFKSKNIFVKDGTVPNWAPKNIKLNKYPFFQHIGKIISYDANEEALILQPYNIGLNNIKKLIKLCESYGFDCNISGKSWHYPGETILIMLTKDPKGKTHNFSEYINDALHDLKAWYLTEGYNEENAIAKSLQQVMNYYINEKD